MAAVLFDGSETETCVQELKPFSLSEIGAKSWFRQHEILERLSLQAAKCVATGEEEFVKELIVNTHKTSIIIHNLIVTEYWRQYVWPLILSKTDSELICFPMSLVLQHAVSGVGLFETLMFHEDVCRDGEEFLIDVVDFCHRQLVDLIDKTADGSMTLTTASKFESYLCSREELQRRAKEIDFQIEMKSISILCDVIEHLHDLPLGIRNRLMCSHDTPMILVHLLELSPWIRKVQTGSRQIVYDGSGWTACENFKVVKLEGKIWIALFRLIHDSDNARKYEFNDFRKARLLKLRPLLHSVLLDQMPYLEPFRRTLEELNIYNPPLSKRDIIIEQCPVIWDSLWCNWHDKCNVLADEQVNTVFKCTSEVVQEQAKSWEACPLDTFEFLEDLLQSMSSTKCASCGHSCPSKRCSRCKNRWYCSKQCQVDDWVRHKVVCVEATK